MLKVGDEEFDAKVIKLADKMRIVKRGYFGGLEFYTSELVDNPGIFMVLIWKKDTIIVTFGTMEQLGRVLCANEDNVADAEITEKGDEE